MDIEKLKQIKKEKGFTFKKISSLSGVPLRTIEDMFAGRTKPRIDTVEAIEKALGISRFSVEEETKTQVSKNFKLKELRKSLCLTQQQVAMNLGIAQQKYQQYESGKYQPDIDTLIKIADFFDVTLDYLLGRSEKKSNSVTPLKLIPSQNQERLTTDEKALLITLRKAKNGTALIRSILLMLGEVRSSEDIVLNEKKA